MKFALVRFMTCFILAMLSSGIALYAPQYSDAQGVSAPLISPGVGSQNNGISRQITFAGNDGNTVFAQSISTANIDLNCQVGTQAELRVTKTVNPTSRFAGDDFVVRVDRLQGVPIQWVLQNGETRGTCLNQGETVRVSEVESDTVEFTPVFAGDGCVINSVIANEEYECVVTNTITGTGGNGIVRAQADGTDGDTALSDPEIEGGVIAQAGEPGPTLPTGEGLQRDPPFARCEDNTPTGTTDPIITPSSMKIVINGKVNLEKVHDALDELDTDQFHLALLNDLKENDGISSSISAPPYMAKIIIQDSHGLKQKIIDYNILDVRRECSYITLAEATGPATNANIAPLGEIGDPERANLHPSEIDRLLVGGPILTTGTTELRPLILNPPVTVCNAGENTNNNFAIYNIRGQIDRESKGLDGNNLVMYWTFDLIQQDIDLAKIVDNNNPFARVDLLTQEEKNRYQPIRFSLTDLWTDCKQIALATDSVFEPFINELNY
jgi:hypothetical protein